MTSTKTATAKSFDHETLVIEVDIYPANTDPKYKAVHYVRNRPGWDGAWFTRDVWQARTYKTRSGAQRWVNEHPYAVSRVVVVIL